MRQAGRIGVGVAMMLGVGGVGLRPHGAMAQMVLPGAVAPTPQGAVATPSAAHPKPKAGSAPEASTPRIARGTTVAVPAPATLVGRTLALDGGGSQITFAADKPVVVTRLTLTGEKISDSQQVCRVDLSSSPLAVTELGRPNGLERIRIGFPACPLAFDVLDGALLVDAGQQACTFAEADCRVRTAGLWGPAPSEIGPDKVKSLEKLRAAADAAVRSNYKALTASTKDRPTIMGFARDQAQFSSSREEVCRDYADEGRHGYCAAKLTQARAALLYDELGIALAEKAARKAKRKAGR